MGARSPFEPVRRPPPEAVRAVPGAKREDRPARVRAAGTAVVEVLPERDYEAWVRLVTDSPDGSIYSLPEYLEILCRAAGGRFRILAVRQGDTLAGGIALYERDSRWGAYVAPRRLLHYNGLVLPRYATRYASEETSRHLKVMSGLAAALGGHGYASVTLSCPSSVVDVRPFAAAGWSARPQYTYVVALDDLARTWLRIEQNLRRLVKRAEGEGIAVREDDDFDAFYQLHAGTMKRVDAESYLEEAAFRQYFESLRRRRLCRLFQARAPDGRVLASQLVLLGPGPATHTAAAAAHPDFLRTGASALVRWKTFAALAEAGFTANDLTDASLGPVTHFKSQLGGLLRLCLTLEAPRAWPARVGHGVATASRRALGALGRAARRAVSGS